MPDTITSQTAQHIRYLKQATLVAGDIVQLTKNGTVVASYTVPAGKTANIIVQINGTVE